MSKAISDGFVEQFRLSRKRLERIFVALYFVFAILDFMRIDRYSHSVSDTLRPFFIDALIVGLVLYVVEKLVRMKSESYKLLTRRKFFAKERKNDKTRQSATKSQN